MFNKSNDMPRLIPTKRFKLTWRQAAPFAVGAAAIGIVVVAFVSASAPLAAFEAESGTVSGGATAVSNSGASGGSLVQFGGGTTTGAPVNTATATITDITSAGRWAYADTLSVAGDTWTVGGVTKTCGTGTGMVCGFQWQKSSDGSTWSNITTGDCLVLCQRTYRVNSTDIGSKFRVIITAGTAQGSTESVSAVTSANATDLTCNTNVTSASALGSAYQSAAAGQVICMASGTYNWSPTTARTAGANVIVKPASGAAVTMSFNPTNASYITLAGPMNLTTSVFDGSVNNITIYNASLKSGANEIVFFADKLNNSNLVVDDVSFINQTGPTNDLTHGRIRTDWHSNNTSNMIGVTVSNSYFSDGAMIDVLSEGGAGLTMLYNEFHNVDNTVDESIHSDTIFNYGTDHLIIKHNWFHDMTDVPGCGWTQWDGGGNNVFEDNVVSHIGGPTGHDGCYESMAIYSDDTSTVNHNVLEPGTGKGGALGQVLLTYKITQGEPKGVSTIVRDNTMASIANGDGSSSGISNFFEDHNLCKSGCTGTAGDQGTGTGTLTGSPTWVGGTGPTSFAGFALAAGSQGIGRASDGTNMGLELPTGYRYPR